MLASGPRGWTYTNHNPGSTTGTHRANRNLLVAPDSPARRPCRVVRVSVQVAAFMILLREQPQVCDGDGRVVRSGCGLECDSVADGFELPDVVALAAFGSGAVVMEVGRPDRGMLPRDRTAGAGR